MNELKDRVAIITGGAQGIGKAIVEKFAQAGATVIIWDIQGDKAQEVAQEFTNKGWKVDAAPNVNVTDLAYLEKMAKEAVDKHGKIDIIVNNAGIIRDASFKKMTPHQWDMVIQVNQTGVFNCTKAVLPYMMEANYGRIISMSSIVGVLGNFGQTNYVAAKAAVIGMTKVWGRELGRYHITANAIAPGFIDTEMTQSIPENFQKQILSRIPSGLMGKPEDIAYTALFLAREEARYISGQVITVSGGFELGG